MEFFKDVDYLIGNFEGTINNSQKIFLAQDHSQKILSALETLFPPERFVLTCANNHSGDYGWSKFNRSYEILKENGFLAIGRKDEPSIVFKDQVSLTCCTAWSNQPNTPYLIDLDEIEEYYNSKVNFNILYPHWGYEMQLYPYPKQIKLTKALLSKWDMIIGHHSHSPQPINSYKINAIKKVVAYSLGNFCIATSSMKHHHGIVIKVELGPDNNVWKTGEVEWKFSKIQNIDKNNVEIRLENTYK